MLRSLKNWWHNRQLEQRNRGPRRSFRLGLETFEERLVPTTIVVTDSVDSNQVHAGTNNPVDENGLISLRSAVAAADVDSAKGTAVTIEFSSHLIDNFQFLVMGAIDLNSGKGVVTIDGGKGYTVSSGFEQNTPVFVGATGSTVIKNMTFNDCYGNMGGAIYNEATLTLTDCSFNNNVASSSGGAIFNLGTMTVAGCTFYDNIATYYGGAIANLGSLTVNGNSTFNFNQTLTYDGGAIMNLGSLSSTKTTYVDNSAAADGGAIASEGSSATLTLNSCAFDRNIAIYGGAIYLYLNDSITNTKPTYLGNSAAYGGDNLYVQM